MPFRVLVDSSLSHLSRAIHTVLIAQPHDVAGHLVGYDSPTRFNREYCRLFGASHSKDTARLRAGMTVPIADPLP
ncbi:hypothetical protein [Nocardia vaccinii]|uniref:hypothetical protein n=1 Tax=Nocardia vaccinii TaxID=1822 RepID=UPI00083271B3|nr:hypothetical protein [Nocardia vaccinii]